MHRKSVPLALFVSGDGLLLQYYLKLEEEFSVNLAAVDTQHFFSLCQMKVGHGDDNRRVLAG